jgi:hypothetical protein
MSALETLLHNRRFYRLSTRMSGRSISFLPGLPGPGPGQRPILEQQFLVGSWFWLAGDKDRESPESTPSLGIPGVCYHVAGPAPHSLSQCCRRRNDASRFAPHCLSQCCRRSNHGAAAAVRTMRWAACRRSMPSCRLVTSNWYRRLDQRPARNRDPPVMRRPLRYYYCRA